jgi:hypothetical protein
MESNYTRSAWAFAVALALVLTVAGCEQSPFDASDEGTASDVVAAGDHGTGGMLNHRKLCNPRKHEFTLDIDNEFFPMPVGRQWVLEGVEDGTEIRVQITVLDETEVVGGVITRVLEEREWEDDELVEVSRNFVNQTEEDTICYHGEEEVPPAPGEWRADDPHSRPGIFMPADPEVGDVFQQEDAPTAKDRAGIIGEDETVTVPYGTFDETLLAQDCNPIEEPGCDPLEDGDLKVYVEDLGIIVDGPAELVAFTPGAVDHDDDGDGDSDDHDGRSDDEKRDGRSRDD